MIITKQKPIEEILKSLEGETNIFLVGCSVCADECQTGGECATKELVEKLNASGKHVTGFSVLNSPCHVLVTKKDIKPHRELIDQSDSILITACGAGAQSVAQVIEKPVRPAVDTLFLGNVERHGHFYEHCSMCGECVIAFTDGICPITNCAKGLLNGPCGGMNKGKCEISTEDRPVDCAWVLIYERLKKLNHLDKFKNIQPAKNYSKHLKPDKLILERKKCEH